MQFARLAGFRFAKSVAPVTKPAPPSPAHNHATERTAGLPRVNQTPTSATSITMLTNTFERRGLDDGLRDAAAALIVVFIRRASQLDAGPDDKLHATPGCTVGNPHMCECRCLFQWQ